jgi:hypothetical protein
MQTLTITRNEARAHWRTQAGRRTAGELRERALARPEDAATLLAIAAGLERLGYYCMNDLTDEDIDAVLDAV